MNTIRKILLFYLFILLSSLIISCAAVKLPPGGPKDTTPPKLIRSDPAQGTTLWEGGNIRLYFSEYMSENGIQKAFAISPALKKGINIDLNGDMIEIEILDTLETDRTYILTISRDLKDEHGVAMEKGTQIAFSTGENIDSGEISGKFFDDKNVSVHLLEWEKNVKRDSVYLSLPLYITDAGDDGSFSFKFLSPGRYCVLGLGKESAGKPYGPAVLRAGIPNKSEIVLINEESKDNIFFKMRTLTKPLKLKRSLFIDKYWGRLFFNETRKELLLSDFIEIIQGDRIFIPNLFLDPENDNNLIFMVDSLNKNLNTVIQAKLIRAAISPDYYSVSDNKDLILDSVRIKSYIPEMSDTTYLKINSPKTVVNINPDKNGGPPIEIVLSRPMKIEKPIFTYSLTKSDSAPIRLITKWKSPMKLAVQPYTGWEENTVYFLTLVSVDTLPYVSLQDTVFKVTINSKDKIGYGNLWGKVINNKIKHLAVEALSIENPMDRFPAVVNSESIFILNTIPSGKYTLFFFEDSNKDFKYSYGEVFPFQPSERFYVYPDTVDIRANWDYELNEIKIGME